MVWFRIWIVHSQIQWLDPTASVLILYLVLKSVRLSILQTFCGGSGFQLFQVINVGLPLSLTESGKELLCRRKFIAPCS